MLRASVPALIAGVLFGAGLALGDMVNPARVLGFLDIAGVWDPALAFVMGGAVLASAVGSASRCSDEASSFPKTAGPTRL
jgi:uncharacterized membrane protein YedE/YeeE